MMLTINESVSSLAEREKFRSFLTLLTADYCRPAAPDFARAYARAAAVAEHRGHDVPTLEAASRLMGLGCTQSEE